MRTQGKVAGIGEFSEGVAVKIGVFAAIVISGIAVSACSTEPQYRTEYTLTPPSTAQGRACVTTCKNGKLVCVSNARADAQQCEADKRQRKQDCYNRADLTYRGCIAGLSSRTTTRENEFRRANCSSSRSNARSACNTSYGIQACQAANTGSKCEEDYRGCFKQCGGKIQARTVCYKNCDKIKK